jgi:hypothetical protein
MNRTALILAAILAAAPAPAANFMDPCPGALMPPTKYDHTPRPTPIYRLVDDVTEPCRDLGWRGGSWHHLLACNGWKDHRWYVILDKHRSVEELRCDVRHEFGHPNEIDAGVDREDDAWHVGWVRQ